MNAEELSFLPPDGAIFPNQSIHPSRRAKPRASSLNPEWHHSGAENRYEGGREKSLSPVAPFFGGERLSQFPGEEYGSRRLRTPAPIHSSKSQQNHRAQALNILAPTPRRHLIETSESQHWLNLDEHPEFSPPLSPATSIHSITESIPASPRIPQRRRLSSTANTPTTPTFGQTGLRTSKISTHNRSYSAAYRHELQMPEEGFRQRRRNPSNASIGSSVAGTTSVGLYKGALRRLKLQHQKEALESASGKRWVRWMHKTGLKSWVIPASIAFATLLKLCIGLGSYSGQSTPPMYGDYEAQRHWLEITTHLPFREWYTYDLQYWGLDYPPLTAYISWLCGIIGHAINPAWVALDASRGIESPGSKLFMRLTVVILDLAIYVPALVMFVQTWQGTRSRRTQELALLTLLLQPGLLLVDHGHFQYNSVMLGLTLLSMCCFSLGADVVGAIFFVLSLGFKQMALYYAPAIGSFLLAKCLFLGTEKGSRLFAKLGVTTVFAFAALFAPFFLPGLAPSVTAILNPITRIFPFNRGLFEDKVANFWCASNVVIKWKRLAESATHGDEDKARGWLVKLSTLLTALGFAPSVFGIMRAAWVMKDDDKVASPPNGAAEKIEDDAGEKTASPPAFISLLPYAMLTSSMSFFLFSFQVHEKTILLPLLPLTLLMSAAQAGTSLHNWGALGNNIAVFSMWPLLKRDGQGLACLATLLLWNRVIGYTPWCWLRSNPLTVKENTKAPSLISTLSALSFVQIVSLFAYASAFAICLLETMVPAPARYPDIFPVLNVLVSTPVFGLIWLWSIKCGVAVGWSIGGWKRDIPVAKLSPKEGSSSGGIEEERREEH